MNRSSLWRHQRQTPAPTSDSEKVVDLDKARTRQQREDDVERIALWQTSWGYRRVHNWLVKEEGQVINRKTVQKIMQDKKLQVKPKRATPRPRVEHKRSQSKRPNERWAIDASSCWSAQGWIGILAVIDCCTRQIVGYHISSRGRAQEAEAALEMGCLEEFGLLYASSSESRPVLRSDNGKTFTSKRFMGRCAQYGLSQEFITPYTPQQNGMIERWFRSLKEECIWLHNFETVEEATDKIEEWIAFYNEKRPHQALNYMSPNEFRAQFSLTQKVA